MSTRAPVDRTIIDWSATELASRLAAGDVSAVEVVEAHVRRIEEVQPKIHALAVPLLDQARARAKEADAARDRGGPLGPLHGVPVTVKEMFDVAGVPTTMGVTSWSERKSSDAPLVTRLRKAGAIVLGKTNVPQLGMMFETDNPVYGRTNNPWDLGRAPGGSSGGEAALVGARGSPLGLASDGGGSIRHPCHCCGVHGLKPTSGRLTLRGHVNYPNWRTEWVQPGPIARTVADLHLALRVLAAPGQDEFDPGIAPAPLGDPANVSVRGLRVGVYEDDGMFAPSPALRRAVREAAAALRERGATIEEFRPPDVAEGLRIGYSLFYADGLRVLRRRVGRGPIDRRIKKIFAGAGFPTPLRAPLRRLFQMLGRETDARFLRFVPRRALPVSTYFLLLEELDTFRDRFREALDARRLDVLLCPPNALPALRHGAECGVATGSYTMLYNLLGMPAGTVAATRVRPGEESDRPPSRDPMVRSARAVEDGSAGLPVGVQVVARHWREHVALAVMAELEGHFRGQPDYPDRPTAV